MSFKGGCPPRDGGTSFDKPGGFRHETAVAPLYKPGGFRHETAVAPLYKPGGGKPPQNTTPAPPP